MGTRKENKMNDLISINYNSEQPTVLGRDLHKALEIDSNYTTWFKRMCEYGFAENVDYVTFWSDSKNGNAVTLNGSPQKMAALGYTLDHQITIPMAKEICMLQRSDKGKEFRQYFIKIEEQWNTPEAVMSRALRFANQKLEEIKNSNIKLSETIAVQEQQIAELKPKASYYDVVLNCKDLVSVTEIAKDYGKSGKWLNEKLHELGIQFKQGGKIWLLYQKYAQRGYTSTKTQTYNGNDGEVHTKVHTYWTQKGRLFIYDKLKAEGILPIMEKS